ncbi:putative diphthamide synthesis protein-domain-containing protein [Dipodascopsis uninucleata]
MSEDTLSNHSSTAKFRRFTGRRAASQKLGDSDRKTVTSQRVPRIPLVNQIPSEILEDEELNAAISLLPSNYDFEIHKCVWNIKRYKFNKVALQMPEGLLIFSCIISDILERFCEVEVVIMGDVTYGACCIDDYTAKALGCDLLIHYAHSCLIPVDVTEIKVLYVFVSIAIEIDHLIATLKENFDPGHRLYLVGTIQFNGALHSTKRMIESDTNSNLYIQIPQISPLSRGEILGCTAPRIDPKESDALIYIGDGRFHLESVMIQNPGIPAYRYDPYSRKFTKEEYEHDEMLSIRREAIDAARGAQHVGIILGTLGRQGNYATFEKIREYLLTRDIDYTLIMLSEIFPQKLAEFANIDAFVQVACPRLSIDWGYAFSKPLLTPYEASIAFGDISIWSDLRSASLGTGEGYKMDYYAKEGLGRARKKS